MSSLIFYTEPNQALVATDTLGVDEVGQPFIFVNKASYLPDIRTIIAGTGVGGFATDWAQIVNSRFRVSGIGNLNLHTTQALRELWADYKHKYQISDEGTSTVYHFGFCEVDQIIKTFVYRSTNDFQSESIGYGTGVKPECKILEGNLVETIPLMMAEQRRIQDATDANIRIYIGGEIQVIHLDLNGCKFFKIGEFEDFRSHQEVVMG
jgi:hypothetical protein